MSERTYMTRAGAFHGPHPSRPTHGARCAKCGAVPSLEVHGGRLVDWCFGCERNRQRADMGLSPLNFAPPETYEPEQRIGHNRGGPKPRGDSIMARVKEKLPTSPTRACHYMTIAASIGVGAQYVNDTLHVLRARGIAETIEGPHPRQRKRISLLWYRVDRRAA